jgi:hypothetical protein
MSSSPLLAVAEIVPPSIWDPTEWEVEDSRPEDNFFYVYNRKTQARVATRRYFDADRPYFKAVPEL